MVNLNIYLWGIWDKNNGFDLYFSEGGEVTKFTCVLEYDTIFRLVSFSLMHANGNKIVLPGMLHLRRYLHISVGYCFPPSSLVYVCTEGG